MIAAWTIGINLMTRSNFGLVTSQMARQSTLAQAKVDALSASTNRMAGAARAAGQAFNIMGLAAAATMAIGIKGAIDLQKATIQAAIGLGKTGDTVAKTTANMKEFRDIALQMSQITGQSLPESMGVIATMATAGVSGAQIKADWKPIAQFTDVLHFSPKDSMEYGDAAKLGAGLAHELRMFNADDLKFGLGEIARLGYLSPHGTVQLATQVRQAAPTLENLLPGSPRDRARQIVELTAWADRMGGLSRFGSGISQLVTNMVAPRSKRVRGAMEDLGVYDGAGNNRFFNQQTGVFDLIGALHQVAQHYKDAVNLPGGRGQAVQSIMGLNANAARYLALLSSKESLTALAAVQRQQKAMGDDPAAWLDKTQTLLMGELSTQTGLLTSNFKTLATLLADGFIAPLTKIVGPLAAATGKADSYLEAHPGQATAIGGALGAWGAWSVVKFLQSNLGHMVMYAFSRHSGLHTGAAVSMRGFGHGAARAAGAAGEAGAAARGGFSILGALNPLKSLKGVWSVLGDIGYLGAGALKTRAGVSLLGEAFAKLGIRSVPLVGELMLLHDAIGLLAKNSKNIGFAVGQSARWIVTTGGPLLLSGFKAGFTLLLPAVRDGFQGFLTAINQVLSPEAMLKLGFQIGQNFVAGIFGGWKAGGTAAPAPPPSGAKTVKGGHVVAMEFHYHAAAGDDATQRRHALESHRKIASDVAGVIASAGRTLTRAAGSVINSATMSSYETAAGTA